MLIDKYGRKITYLRVSVTERCNFNCTYCSSTDPTESVNEVSLEYYLRIIKVLSHLGINKIRLTGGEPFLRTDFVEFISEIKKLNIDVAITTNASLLSESIITKLDKLNIKRFNVSLDTLNKNRFYEITKTRLLNRVIENIKILSSYDINLKLNCVIMKSINSDEVEEFIEFANKHNAIIRFIELMPIGPNHNKFLFYPLTEIIDKLSKENKLKEITYHNQYLLNNLGPGRYFVYNSRQIIGFITPLSNPFCKNCNRLRLTSKLTVRSCLGYNHEIDLKNILSEDEIKLKIFEAIRLKPRKYSFDTTVKDCMRSIGG